MPNSHCIESPVTLISLPRSGTTLMSSILWHHPDFSAVGETANLIFGAWDAVESARGITPPLYKNNVKVSDAERAARVVRQAFLTCFPDEKPYWFQKPIGIPRILASKFDNTQWPEAAAWYWRVIDTTFPKAKYFALLRHPCDVVLSSQAYFGRDAASIWWTLAFMAYLLTHPTSPVEYVVHFELLVRNREKTVRDLFEFLEIPFREEVLNAFTRVHAPSKGRATLEQISVPRRSEWAQLDPTRIRPFYINHLNELFDKFGYSLQWPSHFTQDKMVNGIRDENPQKTIRKLHQKIETMQLDHSSEKQSLNDKIAALKLDYIRVITSLSSQDIARYVPFRRIVKSVGLKIAAKPGFSWLHRFMPLF